MSSNNPLFLDLEFDRNKNIIQIGVVEVDIKLNLISDLFCKIVFPQDKRGRSIAKFMRPNDLWTKLPFTVEEIKKCGNRLDHVLHNLANKFGCNRRTYQWGSGDAQVIEKYCKESKSPNPFSHYVNFGPIFNQMLGVTRNLSLEDALHLVGLQFEGIPHDAGNDARNTARLFMELTRRIRQ